MGFGEMGFLALLVFLLFGPKKVPEVARQVGQTLAHFKRAANDLQAQLALDAVAPSPEGVSDPVLDEQRQTIVGSLPEWPAYSLCDGITPVADDTAAATEVTADSEPPKMMQEAYV